VHLVTHHVEFALDEGVVRDRNTTRAARRAALYDDAHGTNLLLATGVADQPAVIEIPSCAPGKSLSSGREVNGGANTGVRAPNEVSRYLIGAESKPGTVGRHSTAAIRPCVAPHLPDIGAGTTHF
jgi:hypothetical protein